MNTELKRHPFAKILLALALGASLGASAAVTDLSQTPLASSSSGLVKPNLNFLFDSSGSMAWSHAPDESEPFASKVGYKSPQCNSIYYSKDIIYPPPRNADGSSFANASFTGAWVNGFNTGLGTVNLSTSFYAYDNTSSSGQGTDTSQPAYYYVYVGSQVANGANYLNTSSPFYLECSLPATDKPIATIKVSGSGSTSVSSIKVNGTEIMSGTSTASTNTTTVATNITAKITAGGFTATSSGTTITITSPVNGATWAGKTMVVTKTGSMTLTATAFSPFYKVVVGAASGPGGTDERQNFANWFSYYRIRMPMMKSGVSRAFVGIGPNYRVGFETIYATPSTNTADPNFLVINDFDATQKATFYTRLFGQSASGNTPLKVALSTAGKYMSGKLGPDPLQYSCQQQFILLSTDGYWNNGTPNGTKLDGSVIGNQDNNVAVTPRPQYDGGLAGSTNTLADVAAYYYYTDLRNAGLGPCNTGVAGADVCTDNVPVSGLDNNPQQHITLFTVGLGVQGQLNYSSDYLTGGSADYNAILGGSKNWPTPTGDTLTTIDDLWHAAVNGHGQYFSARNPDLLVSGLQSALAGVSAREAAGAAAATSNLEPVAGDNFAYVANYRTQKWDGDVEARTIDLVTGAISTTPVWQAQSALDARTSDSSDSRRIFTYLGGAMRDFTPGSFTAAQKLLWFTPTAAPALSQAGGWAGGQVAAATPDALINYLRGQYGFEERGTNASSRQVFRTREHVLGDIVDAKPVYVKVPPFNYSENAYQTFKSSLSGRTGAVYVGANDGMLHAFDSATGTELWAYVPSFVLPNLKALADDNYPNAHQYYVDGSPTVSDVWTGSQWRTILVAGLNGGGKGYYALDVTDPASPSVLWEYTDVNMGYTYGNPIIGKLSDGTWVVAVTSGYNNADGIGRLYILNAINGTLRFTLSTNVGTVLTPSGLGKISAWVDDGLNDNTIRRIYGGDLLGNLWRFDVNDVIAPAGREAALLAYFQVGLNRQPITTRPELGLVNNKPVVFVGTGRYLGASDLTDTSQQSFYALRDDLSATTIGNARSSACPLVQQTLTVLGPNSRSTSNNTVDFNANCGWYLDFNPGNQTPGERVNVDPKLQLGVLAVATNIPEKSICTVGGSSFLYFFDYSKGTFIATVGGSIVGTRISSSIAVGLNTYRLPDNRVVTTVTTSDDKHPVFGNPDSPLIGTTGKRVLWREILQ